MYCEKCGAELNDEAIICTNCGVATSNYKPQEEKINEPDKNGIAIAGFVCSFFIPLLGWIFGGIGLSRASKRNGKFKGFAIASLVIASIMFLINLAIQ